MSDFDDILDDPFHGAAFAAYVDEAAISSGSPCPERTRLRAYRYFEEALKEHNRRKVLNREDA
jgi:hypothetical protein